MPVIPCEGGILSISANGGFATGPGVSFADSNNISFGVVGNTITASVVPDAGIALAVPGTTIGTGTVVFSNSNNVSFGINGSTVTASVAAGGGIGLAAGTQTATSGTIAFADSNGISFGMSGSSQVTARAISLTGTNGEAVQMRGSGANMYVSNANSNIVIAAGGLGDIFLSNGPGGVYLRGDRVEVAGQSNRTVAFYGAAGATRQTVTGTDATAINNLMNALGSLGIISNAATVSGFASGNLGAIAAGTQTATSGTVAMSNSNGFTFGMSGSSRITASYAGPIVQGSNSTGGVQAAFMPAASTLLFTNLNNASFWLSTHPTSVTVGLQYAAPRAIGAGSQTATNGTINFADSNGVTFGMLGSSQVTASIAAGATATGNLGAIVAAGGTATSGTVSFLDSNNASFGFVGAQSLRMNYAAPRAISAGTTSGATSGTLSFADGGGISFGLNGNTITATVAAAGRISYFDNSALPPGNTADLANAFVRLGGSSMAIQRLNILNPISVTRIDMLAAYTNVNGSVTGASVFFNFYTMSGSTASLYSSASVSITKSALPFFSISSFSFAGINITPGEYLLGLQMQYSTNFGVFANGSVYGQDLGIANGFPVFCDALITATTVNPASFVVSQILSTTGPAARPYIRMLGSF